MELPIFLFSLPRSGSTLLQKVLMSHHAIASTAEPWLLLPHLYAHREIGVLAEYGHQISYSAVNEFINGLENKRSDYYDALGEFLGGLYEKQCSKNEKYFLDKTPRYYNIIPEIHEVFPDAKFIFLFRNPVHIMSSMMNTWSKGNLKYLYAFERDLKQGPRLLSEGYELLKNKSYALRYEDFVKDPKKITKEICEYLEIKFDISMLDDFSHQNTEGNILIGDTTGEQSFISEKSLHKWKNTFDSTFRKKVAYKYILDYPQSSAIFR
ncbi:sulfotransferase family protein [sulfur-oxidizing endosymbiont of Gigantopelta aegis]|uniref:sulfotransferase family protein n=1 Tax=sulfur-oxidizing endosymbiont of Gigantopelta aegis TaxID=2794934 RepID=UPI0018DCE02A|nr:sulfotransferase [sulfur-oxidizing endosymbiont of Gigantopelta aegis]